MSTSQPSLRPPTPSPSSASGDIWPVLPLAAASFLVRTWGSHLWVFCLATVLGTVGMVAAVISVGRCRRAVRSGLPRAKAAWVVTLLAAAAATAVVSALRM
ncbi:hypothetical protein ACH427_28250 [Streptomyces sp. NPDC020379]|uniref:hypothetical protein n=1 Tax=Streptomyces sp. NPDC020379 TaxID=3365071 RepID=UPI0037BB6613